jgi:hypothetical protein
VPDPVAPVGGGSGTCEKGGLSRLFHVLTGLSAAQFRMLGSMSSLASAVRVARTVNDSS